MEDGEKIEEEVKHEEQIEEEEEQKTPEQILFEKRLKIASEIRSTEVTYILALENMINKYMIPLLAKTTAEEIPGISKEDVKSIFSNVEHLLPINKSLLDTVSKKLDDWHENQLIGDIFLKMAPFFRIYSHYQNNYERSGAILTRCQANETFNQVTDEIISTVEGPVKALEGLLIQPIQRIPRYILLLNELERKTPDNHPDKENLKRASDELDRVLTYLDKDITSHEFREKFLNMGTKVKGAENLIKAHRVLIHEGSCNIKSKATQMAPGAKGGEGIKSKIRGVAKEAKLQIWLFNDVLVHLKNTKNKKKTNVSSTEYTWPLQLVWIKDNLEKDPEDPKMPYSFMLVGPRKSYTLHFPEGVDGQQEKQLWVTKITDTVSKVLNEENAPDEVNRFGQYKFPDKQGGEYEGWWRFGKIHGQGTFKIFGNTYTGDWEYNRKSGIGTFVSVTGEVYHGEWKDDKPHGFGQLQYSNNDRYDGEWNEGMRSGKGVHLFENGDKYDGEWANNIQNGEGSYITTTGFIYNGCWLCGRLHGLGVLISPNGRRYEGEFKSGMKHGEGKLDYANGDFFMGQWQLDKPHGYGILHSAVEGVYEGMFVNGYKEGVGKMVYRNGDIYDGSWKRNQFNDKGILYLASGGTEKYEGSFEYGKYHGKGILFYRNGSRYEGQFKDDKPNGNGVCVSANNVLFEGKWVDGRREGKSTLCVGPAKFSSNLVNGVMGKGEASFVVVPDVPAIRVEL